MTDDYHPDYIHWSGEVGTDVPKGVQVTTDKSKVTCSACTNMIEILESLKGGMNNDFC